MDQDRDIDEILASLDALLKESDSHNDDMPHQPKADKQDNDKAEPKDTATDMDNALDKAIESVSNEVLENVVHDTSNEPMPRVVLTEDMLVDNHQTSLPLGFHEGSDKGVEPEMPDATSDDKIAVDEPHEVEQERADDHVAPEQVEEKHSAHSIHLDKVHIEQLLSVVSADVSEQLQQLLPVMIRDSLHKHLAHMQGNEQANKTTDDE
jgi:hypothetical protein